MKFGKTIQAEQIPGWSQNYLDYKFLKKIISSLAANRPASEAAALALGVRPSDLLSHATGTWPIESNSLASMLGDVPEQPPLVSTSGQDDDRGPDFQAHKAAFFFKLERELEKINAFYLHKEGELKMRLETLLSKRRAAAMRGLPESVDDPNLTHAEWSAVEEGFRLLERDLGKIQQFIEINATGFRKILKKWDKRSKSTTKELYLARQVDIQPVFNRQLISELSDVVASCLLDLFDLTSGLKFEGISIADIASQHIHADRHTYMGPFYDLQNDLRKAVATSNTTLIMDLLNYSDALAQEQNGGKLNITRILWKTIIEAPPDLADLILNSLTTPFDFGFVDDINNRNCFHEAAMSGNLRLINLCIEHNSGKDKTDVYGRSALHYAAMNGHAAVCRRLLEVKVPPDILDIDNCSPLVYATMKGSLDCVDVLLTEVTVDVDPMSLSGDLSALSLASQAGHYDVVILLLQHGARCLPNSNGEYPIHLAAREGHIEVCKVLLEYAGWDVPDKYHEWTPLFHAARYGHDSCVQILLKAGARVSFVDEMGYSAVHYAAWYGHYLSLAILVEAALEDGPKDNTTSLIDKSPLASMEMVTESDIDMIPSLSLPPPIMPHRTYGHNFLDRRNLVEISLASKGPAVRLHSRLIHTSPYDHHLPAATPLRLVITAGPDANAAPYSISLPQQEQNTVFVFQAPSLNVLSLTFSIYPNFGTKAIGRAVALSHLFVDSQNNHPFVLPIIDNRLHVIGEVAFEVNLIAPFQGVTLEVGGAVETYWKFKAVGIPPPPHSRLRPRLSRAAIDSTCTSPSVQSTVNSGGGSLTISSLKDKYIYVVVQVTKDLQPVVYGEWLLPDSGFDLGVADVTLSQFEALAVRHGKNPESLSQTRTDWGKHSSSMMMSLKKLMTILPATFGICAELAYPTGNVRQLRSLRHYLDLNSFVDAVLRTIYHTSASLNGFLSRRRIAFTSFCPNACSAVNWKQPNYPVFFASLCGQQHSNLPSRTSLSPEHAADYRLSCLGAAVDFAKMNNLLGIFVHAEILLQVPSLIDEIRDFGLLICAYGIAENSVDGEEFDAFLRSGVVIYKEYGLYA